MVAGGHVCGCQGVCMVARGMHGCGGGMSGCQRGHTWLPEGGMHGCWGCAWLQGGTCMIARGGHVWLLGDVRGCWGACMVGGGGGRA